MMAGMLLAAGVALWSLGMLLVWALCRVAQISDERPASSSPPPTVPTRLSANSPGRISEAT